MKQITFLCFSILLTFSITACKSKPKQESKKIFYEVIGRDDAGARYKHMQSSYSISISSVYFISAEEEIRPQAVIALGYGEDFEEKTRREPLENVVFFEKYGGREDKNRSKLTPVADVLKRVFKHK